MGDIFGFYFNWGILLQIGCVIHFVRRRPNTYWLWIILMFGPLGSLAYIFVEVIPDAGLLREHLPGVPAAPADPQLEQIVLDNPSSGNLEELADLYLEDGKPAKARALYDRAITPRTASIDPYYRRGLAALALDDLPSRPSPTSRASSTEDPKYDFHRAAGLLAHVCARLGHPTTPTRGSSRRPRCPPRRSLTSTTPSSSSRRSARARRATGRSASSTRRRRCRATSRAANGPGSDAPRRC